MDGDRTADLDTDPAVLFIQEFSRQHGRSRARAHESRELEEWSIGSFKVSRRHLSFGNPNQACDGFAPGRVRDPPILKVYARNVTGGKYNEKSAPFQPANTLLHRLEIPRLGVAVSVGVNEDTKRMQLRDACHQMIRHDLCIAPDPKDDAEKNQILDGPKRVIGNDNDGSFFEDTDIGGRLNKSERTLSFWLIKEKRRERAYPVVFIPRKGARFASRGTYSAL
jgi:hypothetical protein